jgi:hypothetical protein
MRQVLGRSPTVHFDAIVRLLLAHDLRTFGRDAPFSVPDLS